MWKYRADEQAAMAFRDLASALDAGLPLDSLGGDPALGEHVLANLCERRGVTLQPAERAALAAAWKSGSGPDALRKRAAARERRAQFQQTMISGLAYPALLFALLLVASLATMSIVGPLVATVVAVAYGAGCVFLVVVARKLGRGDSSLASYPILGGVVTELQELPYLESLHALYGAGVPLIDAHRDSFPSVRMQGLRKQLAVAQRLLEDGQPLHEALHNSASLCQETRSMLAAGEQSGELEDALGRALQRRAELAERKLKAGARTLGAIAYGAAAVGVATLAVLFYTNYYAPIFALMR